MQWWGPGPSQPRSLHSGSQGPGIAKLNDFMEFYLVVEASKRTEVLWNAATVATRVCEDLSPTIVLLCELLVGVCHYFCRTRLFTSKDVRVHGGAIQDQRPLLQFACSNKSSVNVSKIDSASCYRSDTLNSE